MIKYWIVMSPNGAQVSIKHSTYEAALDHAKRCAESNPSQYFRVFEAMSHVKSATATVTDYYYK